MKNMMLKAAISGSVAIGTTAVTINPAQATHFYLGEKSFGSTSDFVEIVEDGITLTLTATDPKGDAEVYQAFDGAGVQSGRDGADFKFFGKRDFNQLDGGRCKKFNKIGCAKERKFFESLTLEFDHTVEIISATFTRLLSDDDEFEVFLGGDSLVSGELSGLIDVFDEFPDHAGKVFDFTVTDKNDGYLLKSVKVEKVAVPEPATMLGLGAVAAAGLLAQKRSRKETA